MRISLSLKKLLYGCTLTIQLVGLKKEQNRQIPWASPLFRWAGSKRQVIGELTRQMPTKFRRYVEPFAGSACLFFALRPSAALLGDNNSELINSYKMIRHHPRRIFRELISLPRTKEFYYEFRSKDVDQLDAFERAIRFIYLNRNCFNGLYRTNKKGEFNVPFGEKISEFPSEALFYRASYALRAAEVYELDFENLLKKTKKGDFVYMDPPYASSKKRNRSEYGANSFQANDLPRLISSLRVLHSRGVRFLLSYSNDAEFIKQLSISPQKTIEVQRNIAGFSKHRKRATEVLITNSDLFGEQ